MNSITRLTPAELRKAANIQEKIQKLQEQLTQLVDGEGEPADLKRTSRINRRIRMIQPKAKRARKMSRAARVKMARLMKARWSKRKAQGKLRL